MTLPPGVILTPEGIFVLERDSHLSRWVEDHKRLDVAADQIAFYSHLIPKGGHVLDAGACIGDHTATHEKLVGASGVVWALEPNPVAFAALRLNFMGSPVVRVRNVGLSNLEGSFPMHVEQNAGASFLSLDGEIKVSVTMIDALKLDRLDFIHLDCEGCEPLALLGGMETISRFRPPMVLEIAHKELARYGASENSLREILDSLGYRCQEIESHHGPHLPNRDILCLPK